MATENKDTQQLRDDLDRLREDIDSLTKTMQQLAEAKGEEFATRARAGARRAQERAEAYADDIGGEIRERPFASMGVAFMVGIVLGRVLGR